MIENFNPMAVEGAVSFVVIGMTNDGRIATRPFWEVEGDMRLIIVEAIAEVISILGQPTTIYIREIEA